MKNILIITDEQGHLLGKLFGTKENNKTGAVLDLEKCKSYFQKYGFEVEIKRYIDVDLDKDYENYIIVYSSSEDRGLFIKEYYEDILLGLQLRGGKLIPRFDLFRSHHNKVYQEIMRRNFNNAALKLPVSMVCYDYRKIELDKITYPCVVKTSAGAGSKGVSLAKNAEQLKKVTKNLSKQKYYNFRYGSVEAIKNSKIYYILKCIKNVIKRENVEPYVGNALYNNKFIIQEYISDLSGDYKVLYYFGKYYILYRKNRDVDFRASGSGKFEFPRDVKRVEKVLRLAKEAVEELDAPILSLDIGDDGDNCYLLEYQAVDFGNYTIQFSDCYYIVTEKGDWEMVDGQSEVELEYCRAVSEYSRTKF